MYFDIDYAEGEDYDNDATFGSGAVKDDGWQAKHQELSLSDHVKSVDFYEDHITFDDHCFSNKITFDDEDYLAHSVSEMVLEDEEFNSAPFKSIPIPHDPDKTFPQSPYGGGIWTAAQSPPVCKSPPSSWQGDNNSPGKMLLQMLKSGAVTPPTHKNSQEPYNAQQTKAKLAAIPARQRSASYSEVPRQYGHQGYNDRRGSYHGNHHGYHNNQHHYQVNQHHPNQQHANQQHASQQHANQHHGNQLQHHGNQLQHHGNQLQHHGNQGQHGYYNNYNQKNYHGNRDYGRDNYRDNREGGYNNRRHYDSNRHQRDQRTASQKMNDKLPQEMDSILMSSSEKQWVTKIQMMQIQTANPYEEDYYYQMLLFKKQQKDTDFLVTPKLLFSNPNKQTDKKEYKPMEFSSTLGKLSISTVMNPRQVLDCSLNDLQPIITNHQKEGIDPARKKYSVLSTIERMYDYLLELEDLERMMLIVPTEERCKIGHAKYEVADRMFSCFCIADSGSINEELLVHVLSTSKGKNMLARSVTQLRSEHGRAILYHLLGNMATIIAHDKKHQQLPQLCTPLGSVVHSGTINMMHVWTKSLLDGLTYYGDLNSSLATVLANRLGLSLVSDVIQRADHLCTMNSSNFEMQAEWIRVLQQLYPYILPLLSSLPPTKDLALLKDSLTKNRDLLWCPATRE